MKYKPVKYSTREEALAAYNRMLERKREWVKEMEADIKRLRALYPAQ